MKLFQQLQESNSTDRILAILLTAFCVVEVFFISLLAFPDTRPTTESTSEVPAGIFGTREVTLSGLTLETDNLDDWRAFAAQLSERYAGEKFAIAFLSLNNPEIHLEINTEQEFVAASTYKLFAAYAMLHAGNPPPCLDVMIIYSENECSVDYLNSYGWSRLTADARAIGAEHTWFDETTHTTASDLVVILKQIYDGSLLNATDNSRLVDDMKQQIFRDGIPAGIPEAEVADKVGFLDGFLHDAGLIYSPKGDFILVILTDGYSWNSIAEVSSEIYANL
jgi:beta-lactamase class A